MSRGAHHILASYDIADPRRLQQVAKIMQDYGERVLKSVFECNLTDGDFMKMKARIERTIDHTCDSVRFYFLCEKCINSVEVSGLGDSFAPEAPFSIT